MHFVVIVIIVIRFISERLAGAEWKRCSILIVCGQQSLAVFYVGVFLSFCFRISCSREGVRAVARADICQHRRHRDHTIVAYYISWSKRQDVFIAKGAGAEGRLNQTGPVYFILYGEVCWISNLPCDENRPIGRTTEFRRRRSIDGILASLALEVKAALSGSLQRTIQLPSGNSIGPSNI